MNRLLTIHGADWPIQLIGRTSGVIWGEIINMYLNLKSLCLKKVVAQILFRLTQ